MSPESVTRVPADRPGTPAEKIECCRRVKAKLREAVADMEQHFAPDVALMVVAGVMQSAGNVERLAQRIAREAGQ